MVLSVLQYGIYYYNNPIEKEVNFMATGCIIWDSEGKEWEMVNVEVKGKKLYYIFKNHREAAQGDIRIDGYSIFGNMDHRDEYIGFYTEFHGENFGCVERKGDQVLCKIIALSEDFKSIVCGIDIAPFIIGSEETGRNGQALLVIPGEDMESAKEVIKNAFLNSEQMNEWLLENEWNRMIETEQ